MNESKEVSGKREREEEDGSLDADEPSAKRSRSLTGQAHRILNEEWGGLYEAVGSMAVDGPEYLQAHSNDFAIFTELSATRTAAQVYAVIDQHYLTEAQQNRLNSPLLDLLIRLHGPDRLRAAEVVAQASTNNAIFCLDRGLVEIEALFIRAATVGRSDLLSLGLRRGVAINVQDHKALMEASTNGRTPSVDFLLDHGADIHARDDLALCTASLKGHTETVIRLLDRGADLRAGRYEALVRAAKKGHNAVVTVLLDRGADIHTRADLPLRAAAFRGHLQTVTLLLDRGADLHAMDDAVLRAAATNGHTRVVELLLDRGADIDALGDAGNPVFLDLTALEKAADNGHEETVRLLLDRGADLHAEQEQALRVAATGGHTAVVALLLDRGADIHARDDDAFVVAAEHNRYDTVALLLDRGADIHAQNEEALLSTIREGRGRMKEYLLSRGADANAKQRIDLSNAVYSGDVKALKALLENPLTNARQWGMEAFFTAVSRPNQTMVYLFLKAGVDIHARHEKALINAVLFDHWNMAVYLVACGADVEAAIGGPAYPVYRRARELLERLRREAPAIRANAIQSAERARLNARPPPS